MFYYFAIFVWVVINLYAYYLMYADQQRAKQGAWRIAERQLLWWVVLGGAWGIFAATRAPLYHKRNKPRIWLSALVGGVAQLAVLGWWWLYAY